MPSIRRASIPEIVAIDAKVFPLSGPPSDAELREGAWWVAVDDADEPLGYAGVWLKPGKDGAYLTRAGVLPAARGAGLQRRLLRVRERFARAHGYERTYTYTYARNFVSMANLVKCGYFPYYTDADGEYIWWQKALVDGVKLRAFEADTTVD